LLLLAVQRHGLGFGLPTLLQGLDGIDAQHSSSTERSRFFDHGMASRQAFLLRSFQRSSGSSNRLLPQGLQLSKQLFAHMSAFTPAITKLVKRTVDALPVARGSVLLGPCLDLFNQRQTLGLVLSGLATDLVQPSLDHLMGRIAGFVKLFPQRMVGCAALVRLLPLLTQLTQRFLHLAATQGLALRAIEQPFGFGDQVLAHLISAPALPTLQFTCGNQSGMDLLLQSSIDVLPLGLEHCAQRSGRACTGFAVAFSRFFF